MVLTLVSDKDSGPDPEATALVHERVVQVASRCSHMGERERKPKSSKEAAELADNYLQARKQESGMSKMEQPKSEGERCVVYVGPRRCYSCGEGLYTVV